MCGLVGFISTTKTHWKQKEEFMQKALFVDTLRGLDGTGIFAVPHTTLDKPPLSYKRALPAPDYLWLRTTKKLIGDVDKYFACIGHNRAATQGGVRDETSHPFTHGPITLVHNGTLISRRGLSNNFAVDSEDICHALAEEEDAKKVLEKLDGAYALIWYDQRTQMLSMARNKERPLHFTYSECGNNLFIASEAWMLTASIDSYIKTKEIYSLTPGKIASFSVDMPNLEKDHLVKDFTPFVPKPVQRNYQNTLPYYGSASYLHEMGYQQNELIEFVIDEVQSYKNVSYEGGGHATVYGRTKGINGFPSDDVVAYSVPLKLLTGSDNFVVGNLSKIVKGRLFSANASSGYWRNGKFELKVDNVREFIASGVDIEPDDVDLMDLKPGDKVLGPDGTNIRVDKFEKLAKAGCAYCGDNVPPSDAEDIIWTEDKRPLCTTCTEVLFSTDDKTVTETH